MTEHELAEHLATIRPHVFELADWHLDAVHVQLHITGPGRTAGTHSTATWSRAGQPKPAGPAPLDLRVVQPAYAKGGTAMSDTACRYSPRRLRDDGCELAPEARTTRGLHPRRQGRTSAADRTRPLIQ